MAAATSDRPGIMERWTHHLFVLAAGNKAIAGTAAGIDPTSGRVVPMDDASADLLYIGIFDETIDATGGERKVNVNLGMEIEVRRWANDTGSPVAADDVGSICNFIDNQTVSMAAGPVAGRVWDVDAALGVAVQKLPFVYTGP